MSQAAAAPEDAPASAGRPRRNVLAWAGQQAVFWLILLIVGSMVLTAGAIWYRRQQARQAAEAALDRAQQLLDIGNPDSCLEQVSRMAVQSYWGPHMRATREALLGLSQLQLAAQEPNHLGRQQRTLDGLAKLQAAETLGFPEAIRRTAELHLAQALAETGRSTEASLRFESLAQLDSGDRHSCGLRLIQLLLLSPTPDLDAAQHWLSEMLGWPVDTPQQQRAIWEATARLELSRGRPEIAHQLLRRALTSDPTWAAGELLAVIASLSSGSPLWQAPAPEKAPHYQDAADTLGRLSRDSRDGSEQQLLADFWRAIALQQLGRNTEAGSLWHGIRQRDPNSPEAIAAGLRLTELELQRGNLEAGRVNLRLADQAIRRQLYPPKPPFSYRELSEHLFQVGEQLLIQNRWTELEQWLSDWPERLDGPPRYRLLAELYQLLAQQRGAKLPVWERLPAAEKAMAKMLQAEPTTGSAGDDRRSADEYLAMAGAAWEQLAQLEIRSQGYPELLWRAIECYRLGKRLTESQRLLEKYLPNENRFRQPRAYVAMAEAALDRGDWEQVRQILSQSFEVQADHPLIYQARLLMARAAAEQLDYATATDLLMANLHDGELTTASPLWRDSLFELGQLLYASGQQQRLAAQGNSPRLDPTPAEEIPGIEQSLLLIRQSGDRLAEALGRLDDPLKRNAARYLAATAHQTAARLTGRLIDSPLASSESIRQQLLEQQDQEYEAALQHFQTLQNELNDPPRRQPPDDLIPLMLRNAMLCEADLLVQLGRYEPAIEKTREIVKRFSLQPESLEALVLAADAYLRIGSVGDSYRTLVQAQRSLTQMGEELDPNFVARSGRNRADWASWLKWRVEHHPAAGTPDANLGEWLPPPDA